MRFIELEVQWRAQWQMIFELGDLGTREGSEACYGRQEHFGVFLRGLVGLDREAAKAAFGEYLDSTTFNAQQIRFINRVIDHLTKNGVMDPSLLFEHPFTNFGPDGPVSLKATNTNAAAG